MTKWLFCLMLPFLMQCAPKVVNFTNERALFDQFETFTVINYKVDNSQLHLPSKQLFDLIETNILKQMERRSYVLSNVSPDLLARYELISNQNTEIRRLDNSYGYYNMPIITSNTFFTSVLLVELINSKSKKIVWQASIDLKQFDKYSDKQKIIESAVLHIFNSFLHKAGTNEVDESLIIKK